MMTASSAAAAHHPGPPAEFPSPRLFKRGDPGGNHGHELKKEEEEAKRYAAAEDDDDDDDDEIDDRSAASSSQHPVAPPYLPTQVELALLCLDHLRDVRRHMASSDKLNSSEGKENRSKEVGRNGALEGTSDEKKDGAAPIDEDDDDDRRAPEEEEGRSGQEDDDDDEDDDFGNLHARMNPHYLTIAVWALQRAFQQPPLSVSNDPYTDLVLDNKRSSSSSSLPPPKKLPSLRDMEGEVLAANGGDDEGNAASPYEYDDHHASNVHRFYRNHGLNSGGNTTSESGNIGGGPLLLGELVAAGLSSLEARSRHAAEHELCQSVLFQQFVSAVTERGFFDTPVATPTVGAAASKSAVTSSSTDSHYQEKFQKVIAKFRTKLAGQSSNNPSKQAFTGDWLARTAAEQYGHHVRRRSNVQRQPPQHHTHGSASSQPQQQRTQETVSAVPSASRFPSSLKLSIEAPSPVLPESLPKMFFVDGPSPLSAAPSNGPTTGKFGQYSASSTKPSNATAVPMEDVNAPVAANGPRSETATKSDEDNANDASLQAAAEALKNQGNVHMQQREFELAADCYTKAIQLCPSGPSSHVYHSNRAAALVSIRQFHLAIADSQRSLALKPDYGKAHARLGLAHFLLGQYELAVHAYSESLRYEPDNRSSRNYLDKATRRLADQREQQKSSPGAAAHQQQSLSSNQSAMATSSVGPKAPQAGRLDPAGVANKSQTPPPPPRDAPRSRSEQPRNDGARSAPSPSAGSAQQQQAEKYKAKGNQFMVQRDYSSAYDAYTRAIELSSDGPQSHVYYSNRAAALCYLERYREAERDSLSSLRLVPGYGKAHARLGLSRFFVGDYEGAASSYQLALEHDPDNAASKSYLLKAQAKLQQQQQQQQRGKE
jgi:tetratricopeptide (TPR) repeat protein